MELGNELISRRGELIFERKREKKQLGVFLRFGVRFSRFAAIYFARSAKKNRPFSIFLNGAEQNGGLPPWGRMGIGRQRSSSRI